VQAHAAAACIREARLRRRRVSDSFLEPSKPPRHRTPRSEARRHPAQSPPPPGRLASRYVCLQHHLGRMAHCEAALDPSIARARTLAHPRTAYETATFASSRGTSPSVACGIFTPVSRIRAPSPAQSIREGLRSASAPPSERMRATFAARASLYLR